MQYLENDYHNFFVTLSSLVKTSLIDSGSNSILPIALTLILHLCILGFIV